MKSYSHRQGSSLISILIALVIIGLIFWLITKTNQKNAQYGTMMKDTGVDTSSYKTIIDSARKVAEEASNPKQ